MKGYFLAFAALLLISVALPINLSDMLGVNFSAALPATALICSIWLLRFLVLRNSPDFKLSGVVIATISFVTIALCAFLAGQYPWFHAAGAPLGAQLGGLSLLLLSCGLFLVVGHQIRELHYLKRLTWLFLFAGGLFCVTHVIPGLSAAAHWNRPESAGSMFWIWIVAISSSQALFNKELARTLRLVLFFLALLAVYRGLFLASSWASGWLPPLVALFIILLFRVPRTVAGLSIISLPAGLYLANRAYALLIANEEYSLMSRTEAWKILWQIFERSPLIGLGPANYRSYTMLYPIWGWYVNFSSHNNYVDILLQTGILGLLAFCWLIVEIIRIIVRLLQSVAVGGFARAYLIGSLGGLAGGLVSGMLGDWIIPFYYNIGVIGFRSSLLFWFFLGGVLALKRITARDVAPQFSLSSAQHKLGPAHSTPL